MIIVSKIGTYMSRTRVIRNLVETSVVMYNKKNNKKCFILQKESQTASGLQGYYTRGVCPECLDLIHFGHRRYYNRAFACDRCSVYVHRKCLKRIHSGDWGSKDYLVEDVCMSCLEESEL